ncbi:hypothetical protein AXK30_03740 [Escherichia coli]|nr:hypothetical protein AXK30_03740 [Escherichia coli]
MISVTEMEAYRNEHTHLNLVEDVLFRTDSGQYLSSHFLMDTEISFCGNFMMLLMFVIKTVIIKKRLSVMISEI